MLNVTKVNIFITLLKLGAAWGIIQYSCGLLGPIFIVTTAISWPSHRQHIARPATINPQAPAQQQLPIQSTPVIKLCENCWVVKRGANSSRNNDYLQRKVEISGRFCLLTFQSVEQTVLLFLFLAAPVTQLACRLDLQAGEQLLT